jgi:multiple sugar transport system permease protein
MAVDNVASQATGRLTKTTTKRFHINLGYALIAPYMVGMLLFGIGPMIVAFIFSFSAFEAGRPQYFQAGLDNFITAYTDYRFIPALRHVLSFAAITVPVGVFGSLLLALIMHATRDRLNSLFRTLYFLPGAVTGSVVVLIFIFLLDPAISPFGFLMRPFGMEVQMDVITPRSVLWVFVAMRFFSTAGGWIAIFYGALNGISQELLEAAEVDGCNALQLAWHVKRPLITSYVVYMLITMFTASLQIVAEPSLIASATFGSSPVTPYWSLNQLAANLQTLGGNFGLSATIALIQLAITTVAAVIVITRTNFYQTDVQN